MSTMANSRRNRRLPRSGRRDAVAFAFLTTLLGGHAQAVDIPSTPLQTVAEYPPPNVRFILDDSGSMGLIAMPEAVGRSGQTSGTGNSSTGLSNDITDNSYVYNTIFYNPSKEYKAWIKADGTRYTSGVSYTSAWNNTSHLSSSTNLQSSTQTYFVPIDPDVTANSNSNYYRYQIHTDGRVVRSEWTTPLSDTQTLMSVSGLSATRNNWTNSGGTGGTAPANIAPGVSAAFTVPANVTTLTVTTTGSDSDANLYVRRGSLPTTGSYHCRSNSSNSNESCSFDDPTSGTWYVGVRADNGNNSDTFAGVTLTVTIETVDPQTGESSRGCSTSSSGSNWRKCTYATPTGRSEAAERTNYATWHSYHSTRMKTAKAGAFEAFYNLDDRVRVGFDSINRNAGSLPYGIPVNTDNGLFRDDNKEDWFEHLYDADADNSTLLHRALQRAGESYKSDSENGPWGPESGSNQIACRQNFAILTTDGWWNSTSGYTAVGDSDNTVGDEHEPGEGVVPVTVDGTPYVGYRVENPYRDNFSTSPNTKANTLADVAMEYWKTDLRDLENNVPASASNPAFWQHMVTFGVSIGLKGTLDPTSGTLNNIRLGIQRWPDPIANDEAERIDDLWHAAVNGRGQFVVAADSDEFQRGLMEAFETIAQRQGTASNVTANSTTFIDQTRIYQASYTSREWSGELIAYSVSSAGIGEAQWVASEGIPPVATRKVYTWNSALSDGAVFPTAAQTTALDKSARALSPVSGADNAAYIKGDRSKEGEGAGKGLRERAHVLGDIIHSSPIYVQDNETLFVGSNGGMLHAINANTGVERFAYVPAGIDLDALASLSDPFYTHEYFVDGPVVVTSKSQTPDKNILVATLGRGGKGLFSLDVTTPEDFDPADDVLWQLNTGANMGYITGDPLLATLNDSEQTKVVIFGNGFNSDSENAVLYVVELESGEVLQEIDTLAGSDNGLMAPRGADLDGNGTVDTVYAGDLKGNIWKFDFSAADGTGTVDNPLFTAAAGQAFTGGLALGRDPDTNKVWVFAGSGRFIASADLADSTVQSIYGIIDDGATDLTRGELQERGILHVSEDERQRAFEEHASLPNDVHGWFIDLDNPTAGERIITRPLVRQSVLIFASLIPPTDNTCNASGRGYVNALDAFTGTSTTEPYFLGGNGDGLTLTPEGGEETPTGSYDAGVGQPTQPVLIDDLLVVGGTSNSGAVVAGVSVNPIGIAPRRASWRELVED